jgi:uncharacterized DUF497 family protein
MSKLSFEWDKNKDNANQKKHKVSFDEAKSVFYDEKATLFFDGKNSSEEDRFLMLGMSAKLRILIVSHVFKPIKKTIRIISARKATKKEAENYSD